MCFIRIVAQLHRHDFQLRTVPLLEGLAVRIATPSVAAWELGESSSFSINPDRHANNSHYCLKTTTQQYQARPSRRTRMTSAKMEPEKERQGLRELTSAGTLSSPEVVGEAAK